MWQYLSLILALETNQKTEAESSPAHRTGIPSEFKASLGYIAIPCLKTNQNKQTRFPLPTPGACRHTHQVPMSLSAWFPKYILTKGIKHIYNLYLQNYMKTFLC